MTDVIVFIILALIIGFFAAMALAGLLFILFAVMAVLAPIIEMFKKNHE